VAQGVKRWTAKIGDQELHFGVAHGLGNAHTLLRMVQKGEEQFHFVEIMGCPGGCIGGGGQPYAGASAIPLDPQILSQRACALYNLDKDRTLRCSHHNPDIQQLYTDYLGEPLGHKSHELLHTY